MVTSETTATIRNRRNSPEIEPDINPEETPPRAESQLSNNHEEKQKEAEEDKRQRRRRDESERPTEPAELFLHLLENETDGRSQEEPVDLPDPDDAIISQASSLPPESHFSAETFGGLEHNRAADANARVDEIDSFSFSLQQPQEPLEEPHGLPNPDNALIEQATSVNFPPYKKRKMS